MGGEDSHFDSLFFFQGWFNKPPTRLFKWKMAEQFRDKQLIFWARRGRCSWWDPMGFPDRLEGPPPVTQPFKKRHVTRAPELPGHCLVGGNPKLFYFHPENWGRFPIWRSYFSKGLVQPPTSCCFFINLLETFLVPSWCKLVNVFRVLASNIWTMCIRASKSVVLPDGLINTQNNPSCLSKNLVNYSKLRYENRSHIPCS